MAQIHKLFQLMIESNASDLHLSSGSPPYIRIDGQMLALDHPVLTNESVQTLVFEIISERHKKTFIREWELDCSYKFDKTARFRINVFMQNRGLGAVFRVIPEKIKSIEELSLPPIVNTLARSRRGLILVTGPTGSGKSTTLAAIIDLINSSRKEHILTIEDPIEFVHFNKKSLINQREVSSHTKSFANALKAALREDPDIILVGEMRNLETIQLALTAAETGHLVFGTLHTSSAAKTIDRIIDVFPENQQSQIRSMLADGLKAVIAQTLLPKATGKGRAAVLEIMTNIPSISNLIREGKLFQIPNIMQTHQSSGMLTFESSLQRLIDSGTINQSDAEQFLGQELKKKNVNSNNTTTNITLTNTAANQPAKGKTDIKILSEKETPSTQTGFGFGQKKTG